MFVLIWMHFPWWFQIWSWNSKMLSFFWINGDIFGLSSALACRVESINYKNDVGTWYFYHIYCQWYRHSIDIFDWPSICHQLNWGTHLIHNFEINLWRHHGDFRWDDVVKYLIERGFLKCPIDRIDHYVCIRFIS